MIEILIMSMGRSEFFSRALQSIRNQNPIQTSWQVKVIRQTSGVNREKEILTSQAEWVLFLDEDCYLPDPGFMQRFEKLIASEPSISIWGGRYLNADSASYSVKAYNELCNLWTMAGDFSSQSQNILGGCLAVHIPSIRNVVHPNPIQWGGEDTFFIRKMQKAGRTCRLSSEIDVIHAPHRQKLTILKSRAQIHGAHRKAYDLGTKSYSKKTVIQAFRNIQYWPVWLVHFAYAAQGSSSRTVGPKDKTSESE